MRAMDAARVQCSCEQSSKRILASRREIDNPRVPGAAGPARVDAPVQRFALAELTKIPGVRRAFDAPFFNEFTLEFPRSVKIVNTQLLRDNIVGPLPLGTSYPELTKHALVCVTETTTRAGIAAPLLLPIALREETSRNRI